MQSLRNSTHIQQMDAFFLGAGKESEMSLMLHQIQPSLDSLSQMEFLPNLCDKSKLFKWLKKKKPLTKNLVTVSAKFPESIRGPSGLKCSSFNLLENMTFNLCTFF